MRSGSAGLTWCLGVALAVWISGSAIALACIWVLLGFVPVIVPVVSRQAALELYAFLAGGLIVAIVVLMSARRIGMHSWERARLSIKGNPKDIQYIDAWFGGTGLVLFMTAVVVPPMIGAMVLISPWMGLVAVAATGAAIQGLIGWSNTARVIGHLQWVLPVSIGPPRGLLVALAAILVAGMATPGAMVRVAAGIAASERTHIDRLTLIDRDIERMLSHEPELRALYDAKIAAEGELVSFERAALHKGVASPVSVTMAMVKAIDADIARANARSAALDALTKLQRERIDITAKLRALSSVAPALAPH